MPSNFGTMTIVLKDLPEVKEVIDGQQDMLNDIADWVAKKSEPNQSYAYSRCVICDCAWWGGEERHNLNCWVPRLQKITVVVKKESMD